MEFKITPYQKISTIEFNYAELKAELADKLVKYKGTTYDDSAISLAKKDKANLNKLRTAIEDKRKEIKKDLLEPYTLLESQIKDIVSMIDKPVLEIDTQIKNYEERVKADKQAEIQFYFDEVVGNLKDILKLDKLFNDKWLNVTYNMKSIKEEIDESIKRVNADLEVIKGLNSEFNTELMNEYLYNFDLSAVLRKKTMLEERKKAIEELEQKKREQELARNNHTDTTSNLTQTKNTQPTIYITEQQTSVKDDVKTSQENIITLDFRVWGTQEQILKLKMFLNQNDMKFGRVE
jgi:hypothetical protein